MRPTALLALVLCACPAPEKSDTGACFGYPDADGDGYAAADGAFGICDGAGEPGDDCDDGNPALHPGAEEVCDGLDQDCDAEIDEGTTGTWHPDDDLDGYGDAGTALVACAPPAGAVEDGTDCDDGDAGVHPGAAERCDGEDQDCDGEVDEDVQATWYADADADGSGDPGTTVEDCDPGPGWVSGAGDCDDGDAGIHPDATETCDGVDQDCDGVVDDGLLTTWYADADGDGHGDPAVAWEACEPGIGWVADAGDCDDANSSIHPAATELCNGYDDDCDGLTDDLDPDLADPVTWYLDMDGDGWGDASASAPACTQPSGFSALAGDCDDTDPAFNPGAPETDCADPNDYNCDGSTGWADADGDGWAACEECDDADAAAWPGADEVCDGTDDDCDGSVDEPDALDAVPWYADVDGDGYGDAGASTEACSAPAGFVADATDCDDADPAIHPGAPEPDCTDPTDYDCDGSVAWADVDGDGWAACEDCDDGDPAIHPGAPEPDCTDPTDYDCDGSVAWADADGDGWAACEDCDDTDAASHPGATEHCDGVDEDCDGSVDDGAVDPATWYADVDGDGYGDAGASAEACSAPAGFVADATDCDDGDPAIHPGAPEPDCSDPTDYDCDGSVAWADVDGDGWAACEDCDDGDAGVNPAADEFCDGVDDDCDGIVDEGDALDALAFVDDADGDGWGDLYGAVTWACEAPSGMVPEEDGLDCDDADPAAHPGAAERCDGADDDCDGSVDEGVLGTGAACPAESCDAVLADDPSAPDGSYWIDVRGVATELTCDMASGGWTLVFSDDFETSVDPGWSLTGTYACGPWGRLLGGYGIIAGGSFGISVDTLGLSHAEAWVELGYAALDSWDGETGYVTVDGATIWALAINNHSTALSEVCGWDRGYYGSYDSAHAVSVAFSHGNATLALGAGSTLDQASTDESFGLTEVWVWVR